MNTAASLGDWIEFRRVRKPEAVAALKRQARAAERYRQLSDKVRAAEARLVYARWVEADRAVAGYDAAHKVSVVGLWELPFFRNGTGVRQGTTIGTLNSPPDR